MQKRNQKFKNSLQMVLLRLKDRVTLKKVELYWEGEKEILPADKKNPGYLLASNTRLPLEQLPQYLEKKLGNREKATVKIIERGSTVKLELLPGDVKMEITTQDEPSTHENSPEPGTRQNFIRSGEAGELLKTLGIMTPDGKIKADMRRKFFQVDRFVELIDELIENGPLKEKLTVLDCGCGKSYLSFVLNYWLTEKKRLPCKIIGIDDNPEVIASSQKIQQQLGYHNMEFRQEKILDFQSSAPVDMVLSLHACDTATDEALALGLHLSSSYIIAVPCCQAALHGKIDFHPWEGICKHNIFQNRLADVFTDGLRVAALEARNYRVSVVEYVSPLETPKNIMLRASRGYPQPGARTNYQQLKAKVRGTVPLENFLKTLEHGKKS